MTRQLMLRRCALLQKVADFGYHSSHPIAQLLLLHLEILKAGTAMAQALDKLKGAQKSDEGKLTLLKNLIKQADLLHKQKELFDLKMPLPDPHPMDRADTPGEQAPPAPEETAGEDKAPEETAGEDKAPEKTAGEDKEKESLSLDFGGVDVGEWALVLADPFEETIENEKGGMEDVDMDAPGEKQAAAKVSLEELPPAELQKKAEENVDRIHQDFFQIDSFKCFHDMLFGGGQDLFTDTVLQQISGHKGRLVDASSTVKKNIAPALPLSDQPWRTEITGDSPKEDALSAAAKGMISKILVKGEPFIKMVDTLHQDRMPGYLGPSNLNHNHNHPMCFFLVCVWATVG